ncbi:hypothetical protein K8942_05925 [Candidatus Peribacteria bacterium]|nr:MAG: hypothetical protein K8942_05925 [Candidatus Peribacteria bacterium]
MPAEDVLERLVEGGYLQDRTPEVQQQWAQRFTNVGTSIRKAMVVTLCEVHGKPPSNVRDMLKHFAGAAGSIPRSVSQSPATQSPLAASVSVLPSASVPDLLDTLDTSVQDEEAADQAAMAGVPGDVETQTDDTESAEDTNNGLELRSSGVDPETAGSGSEASDNDVVDDARSLEEALDDECDLDADVLDEDDFDEVGELIAYEPEDFAALGIDPRNPTRAKPGSETKILTLAARYQSGLPLWHDEDNKTHAVGVSPSTLDTDEEWGSDPEVEEEVGLS